MRFGGIVLAVLLTLGACTSDPDPKGPTRTATTTTPTATLPTMPPQAKQDTPSGAANFVSHYVRLVNFAANTGDTKPMLDASSDCAPCQSYASEFAKPPTDGKRFQGTFWRLRGASVSRSRSPLEVQTKVTAQEGSAKHDYVFAFVLNSSAPFAVKDIYIVEDR